MPTRNKVAAFFVDAKQAEDAQIDRAFLRDLARLERLMVGDLAPAFRALGRLCAAAYLRFAPRSETRQVPIDPLDADLVDNVIRASQLSFWVSDTFIPAVGRNYLRTYEHTFGTVRSVLGYGVELPDTMGQRILREGGTRAGLVDIQGQARQSLFNSLAEGRAAGENAIDLAKRIEGTVPGGRFSQVPFDGGEVRRARLIARTEIKFSQNGASIAAYRQSSVVTGVRVLDAQKGDYDQPCIDAKGQVWTLDYADSHRIQHPNCTRSFKPIRT